MQTVTSLEFLANELKNKGIRPSIQRIKILECLHQKGMHPTVDDIHRVLVPGIPSLSKATVYNTLHAFSDAGIVRTVNIDGDEIRYDSTLPEHGHFSCETCGTIYNFEVDIAQVPFTGLEDFKINKKDMYFKGLCPNCLHNKNGKRRNKNG